MGLAKGNELSILAGNTLEQNLNELLRRFKVSRDGFFGVRGKGRSRKVRNYPCVNPGRIASEFVHILAANPSVVRPIPGKGFVWVMRDGGRVVYRWKSSSDGTPVVELVCAGVFGVADQKIHFVPTKKGSGR